MQRIAGGTTAAGANNGEAILGIVTITGKVHIPNDDTTNHPRTAAQADGLGKPGGLLRIGNSARPRELVRKPFDPFL